GRQVPVLADAGARVGLHSDEVASARGLEPGTVELLTFQVARGRIAHRLLVRDGQRHPYRVLPGPRLDRRERAVVGGGHHRASGLAVAEDEEGKAFGADRSRRRLEYCVRVRERILGQPGEYPFEEHGDVRLVEGGGRADEVAEVLRRAFAIAGEEV